MFYIYFLISENRNKTYLGFSNNMNSRLKMHRHRKVKSTKNFGNFTHYIIDTANNIVEARKKEKYYKSCAGRKKLKMYFDNI